MKRETVLRLLIILPIIVTNAEKVDLEKGRCIWAHGF